MSAPGWSATLALRGGGGEPVDLRRCVLSHGLNDLPPLRPHEDSRGFDAVIATPAGAELVRVRPAGAARARISARTPPRDPGAVTAALRRMLRLDQDLSPFYALIREDPDLAWCADGAGRMMRSQTVFEDVIKTICTTNCAWSATVRMVGALVRELGDPARGEPGDTPHRAFPAAAAMAAAPESFYADVVRAGYRGPYMRSIAQRVASGDLDLESLAHSPLDDDALEEQLLALPGVGPYAAAHILMLLGRHSRLILDSWTRPKWAAVTGRKASDATLMRRHRRYGEWSGLAFWMRLTRDWAT